MLNYTSIFTLLILISRKTNLMSNLPLLIFLLQFLSLTAPLTISKERALSHVWKFILRLFQLKNMFTGFKTCTLRTQHFLHFFHNELTNAIELKALKLSFPVNTKNHNVWKSQEFPQINACTPLQVICFCGAVFFVKTSNSIDCQQKAVSHFFLLFYFQIANSSSDDISRLTNKDGVAEIISQCNI